MDEILIIEDQPEIAYLYERILAPAHVTSFADVPEAREYLEGNSPQLIILDFYLPSGSGLQLLPYLRNHPTLCEIPIIGISSDDSLEKRAKAAGVQVFLTKPIDLQHLRTVSNRLLGNS